FYRKLGRRYPRIVRGEGCWLYDEQGKDYLDAVGGAYVANLGHSNPDVADALARQAREFGYLSATAFTHGPVEELARELAATLTRTAAIVAARTRGARPAAAPPWRPRSGGRGPTRWPHSSRSRWAAPRRGRPRRARSTSARSGRSATAIRCCSWPTRSCAEPVARAPGGRSINTVRRRTS